MNERQKQFMEKHVERLCNEGIIMIEMMYMIHVEHEMTHEDYEDLVKHSVLWLAYDDSYVCCPCNNIDDAEYEYKN